MIRGGISTSRPKRSGRDLERSHAENDGIPESAREAKALCQDNSMQHIALERSGRHRPCRRPPLAKRGRIRRRCMVHPLSDRHAAHIL